MMDQDIIPPWTAISHPLVHISCRLHIPNALSSYMQSVIGLCYFKTQRTVTSHHLCFYQQRNLLDQSPLTLTS